MTKIVWHKHPVFKNEHIGFIDGMPWSLTAFRDNNQWKIIFPDRTEFSARNPKLLKEYAENWLLTLNPDNLPIVKLHKANWAIPNSNKKQGKRLK